jgi:hypothetical protein
MTARQIRREKAILIEKLTKEGDKNAYITAGTIINKKYGKGWAEKYTSGSSNKRQTYDEWWQERNMDGSFAYNGVTDDF